jgi:hypothetical protein
MTCGRHHFRSISAFCFETIRPIICDVWGALLFGPKPFWQYPRKQRQFNVYKKSMAVFGITYTFSKAEKIICQEGEGLKGLTNDVT